MHDNETRRFVPKSHRYANLAIQKVVVMKDDYVHGKVPRGNVRIRTDSEELRNNQYTGHASEAGDLLA